MFMKTNKKSGNGLLLLIMSICFSFTALFSYEPVLADHKPVMTEYGIEGIVPDPFMDFELTDFAATSDFVISGPELVEELRLKGCHQSVWSSSDQTLVPLGKIQDKEWLLKKEAGVFLLIPSQENLVTRSQVLFTESECLDTGNSDEEECVEGEEECESTEAPAPTTTSGNSDEKECAESEECESAEAPAPTTTSGNSDEEECAEGEECESTEAPAPTTTSGNSDEEECVEGEEECESTEAPAPTTTSGNSDEEERG